MEELYLKTKRLTIRRVEKEDHDDYREIYCDENLIYIPMERFTGEIFDQKIESLSSYSICHEGKVIGTVSLIKQSMPDCYEIGYMFSPSYHHQGFAYEAVSTVIDYAFNRLKAHRIFANIDTRNTASAKLCERLGMKKEAHFREDYFMKGEWTDSYIYALLDKDRCGL